MGLVLPQCPVDLLSFTSWFFSFMGQSGLPCVSFFQPDFHVLFFIYPKNAAVFSRTNGLCGKKKILAMIFIVLKHILLHNIYFRSF